MADEYERGHAVGMSDCRTGRGYRPDAGTAPAEWSQGYGDGWSAALDRADERVRVLRSRRAVAVAGG